MTDIKFAEKALEAINKAEPIHRWFVTLDPNFYPAVVCKKNGHPIAHIEYNNSIYAKINSPYRLFSPRPIEALEQTIKEIDSLV